MEMTWQTRVSRVIMNVYCGGTHIDRDVNGHIATLGHDNGERRERAIAEGVVHLGGTLEETTVEVGDPG